MCQIVTSTMEKEQAGKGLGRVSWWQKLTHLYRLIQKYLSNKLTFEQKPKGNVGISYANIWCKRLPGSRNKYRGSKVGAYLCLEPSEKPAMSGVELTRRGFL